MILKSLAVVVIVIAGVLLVAATRPNTFRIERSVMIHAAPDKVFLLIDDFHQWKLWAPQDREDASLVRSYSGAESGNGAISDWKGKGQSGSGRMTIVESRPDSQVTVQANWTQPMKTVNTNRFVLEPTGSSTKVTWTMEGSNLYMMKVMSVFVNMDRMMGRHFEDGLRNLKEVAER